MRVISPIATLLSASLLSLAALAQVPATPQAAEAPGDSRRVPRHLPRPPARSSRGPTSKPGSTDSCPTRSGAATSQAASSSSSRTARSCCRRATATPTSRRRLPVDPEATLFRPGSVSKLFTWTAVMQQVERGKLDLDGDVNQYLDFEIPPGPAGEPVRVRDLMTHTAGFEEALKELISEDPSRIATLEDTVKGWVPGRIFEAGTMPAYSNYATGLAGYLVERTSGLSFDDYLDQNIFGPLGMRHSSFRQPLPEALAAGMAQGYEVATGKPQGYELINLAPAGSLAATGSRHGALHDRAPAERRVRRRADPVRGDREEDARHAAHDHPEREPHAARLLRDGHQRPPHHLPRRRHAVFPQRPAPVRGRRRRLLHLVQLRRQGRRGGADPRGVLPQLRRPLLPRPRGRGQSRRGDGEGARGRDRRQLHQLAPARGQLHQRPQHAAAAESRRERGRHDLAAVAHGPQQRADEMARDRALRLARGERQGAPRGRSEGRQGHALRTGVDLALHVHGALVRR